MRRLAAFLAIAFLPLAFATASGALAARPGFVTSTVASGFTYPTAADFLPDGRLLVAEKAGKVWMVVNGVTQPTPVIDLSTQINSYWDRGLTGMAVDPSFATNGYIYLYYPLENNTGDSGTKVSRLSRYTMVGNTASPATEKVILGSLTPASCNDIAPGSDCIPADFYGHLGGSLEFAPDGTLFLGIGESGSWDVVNDNSLRAQNLDSFAGKIVHITKDGKGLPANPFWTGNPDDLRSKLWAYGFRNPFRLDVSPDLGIPFVGDVGWDTWDEVDKVPAGGNYGWPCYEGPSQQSGYASKPACQALYAQGTSAVKMPMLTIAHQTSGSAVVGGVFLKNSSYPALYRNSFMFGDYAQNWIHTLQLNETGDIGPGGGEQGFATAADGPVDFTIGPDGAVYYVAILSGEVRRIGYQASGGPTYLSDLSFNSATNGSGPVERDQSNGGNLAGDGVGISVAGVTYTRGVGVAAPSQIDVDVPPGCTAFQAVVGVDDEVGSGGTMHFTVGNGSTVLWQSAVMTGSGPAQAANVPLSGVTTLRLTADDAGDGATSDHGDWADAQFVCGTDTTAPVVLSFSPADGATGADPGVAPVARFSEALNAATVSTSTVTLKTQPGGVAVAGSVTYDATSRAVTFTPTSPLAKQTSYLLQLTGGSSGITDLAGNQLSGNPTATFTTGSGGPQTRYVSDMTWGTTTNGWGPPERDHSNGEQASADGGPIRVAGTTYPKGIGAHANSTIPVDLTGLNCTRFQSVLGVDDEVGNQGSVRFEVWNGTATRLFQSAALTGASAAATADVDVTGVTNLRLVVTDNGDGISYDHADWADAKLTCGSGTTTPPPTVVMDTPAAGATFSVGATVSFTGHANASDGSAIPASQLSWDVQLRHCPQGVCHLHPITQLTGAGGSITFPDHGDDSHIDIKLTATDGAGRSATVTRTVEPNLVNLTLATSPAGLAVVYNGETVTGPTTRAVPVNGTRTISAPDNGGYTFQSWSDGGALQHDVTMGSSNRTITATFTTGSGGPQTRYVSDMTWGTTTNGWGPPERDHSNGEQASADGGPIRVAGTTYPKGIGAHANSTIPVDLTGLNCTRFQSVLGVDDEVGNQGSVRFEVWNGTATRLFQSAALTGASAAATADVDVTGVTNLRLVVTDNGDGISYDHADWADAKLTCGSGGGTDNTPPTVTGVSPTDSAISVSSAMTPTATFSEPIDPTTLTTATFTVTREGTTAAVAGAVGYDASTRTATLDATDSLVRAATYTARIKGGASGVKDGAGNALTADRTWTFTTATEVGAVGLFGPPVAYPAGVNSHGAALGDVDGDGIVDLVVANAGDSTIAVLKGSGSGTFGPPTPYPTGLRPKSVALSDLDGDGRLDAVTANQDSSTVSVIRNSATGFQPKTDLTVCSNAHEVAIGDLNGDGKKDLAVACWGGTVISVLLGNGNGTFQAATNYPAGSQPHSIVIGDFNRDGRNDMAVANYGDSTVSILLANGSGGYTSTAAGVGAGPHSIRSGDIDGNGTIDLVTANDGGTTASLLLGNGDGTFAAARTLNVGNNPKGVAVADVNGDGKLDVLTANAARNYETGTLNPGGDTFSLLLGDGTGGFSAAATYTSGPTPFAVVVGDIDGDGRPDVVTVNWDGGTVSVLKNTGSGSPPPPPGNVTHYLSDLTWTSSSNGWGPVERNTSNGEQPAGDGLPLTIAGVTYAKGVGSHAASEVDVDVTSLACTRFQAVVGLDDEVGTNGTVQFEVWNASTRLYQSPIVRGTDSGLTVDLDVSGKATLRFVVTNGGDNVFYDHADWGDAKLTCNT